MEILDVRVVGGPLTMNLPKSSRLTSFIVEATKRLAGVIARWSRAEKKDSTAFARVFVSYRRQEPDKDLAQKFADALKRAGHEVFIDTGILLGTKWPKRIPEALNETDFLLLLLSREAANSEMVTEEVMLASELAEEGGRPAILPIRLRYPLSEPLPHLLSARLRSIQQELWTDERDTPRLKAAVLEVVSRGGDWTVASGVPAPMEPYQSSMPAPPAPYVDPRLHLGGAIDLQARYYVPREADQDVFRIVREPRGLATVQGPRQSGKTSLILRTLAAVEQTMPDLKAVYVDFQALVRGDFDSLDTLWHAIADHVARRLGHDESWELSWEEGNRYDRSFERFLDSFAFRGSDDRLLLCFDECDRVFRSDVSSEFFASVRAFYNRGAFDPTWKRVSWLLATSSEPTFFIEDLSQSPFNIGYRADLQPFTETQISDFATHFGLPREVADPALILAYVGGQPYLVHLVLYHLDLGDVPPEELFEASPAAKEVFREHLHRFFFHFQRDKPLARAMKRVVKRRGCDDPRLADRLRGAGLVKEDGDGKIVPLCELYADFFREEL